MGRAASPRTRADAVEVIVAQPVDEMMNVCAVMRDQSERRGLALGQKVQADRWIAATAVYLAAELVSDDAVFQGADGLPVRSRTS